MNELNREFAHNCTIHTSIPTMKTIDETAVLLGLPKHWVRQKVLNGEIVAVRSGKRYLVNVDKLIEYLNRCRSANLPSCLKCPLQSVYNQ